MEGYLLLMISLIAFSLVARRLGKEILSRRVEFAWRTPYSHMALRLERGYKLLAYGVMLVLISVALVSSFVQVLAGEPF